MKGRFKRAVPRATTGTIALAVLAIGATSGVASSSWAAASTSPGPSKLAPIHGPYDPDIDTANFVRKIDNRYFPLIPGTRFHYQGVRGNTPQTDNEVVTHKTKRILGVRSTVVRDTVSEHGKPVERTFDYSQYTAYIDGRIEEVALDYYAQDDDGSVWYLGEEVRDYDPAGLVDSTLGTWLAGRDGPPEMIMPADPQVGDVHRAENIPAIAFEEVEIKEVGKTVGGPAGPVKGAIVAKELHDDGTFSDKVFAPGYGEFFTAHGGELEALALAVPTDALKGSPPAELEALSRAAAEVLDRTRSGAWKPASNGLSKATRAWAAYRREQVPPRLAAEMNRALKALGSAIGTRDRAPAGSAAIDVAQSALDLELRYRPSAKVDLGRFELWANQVLVDAAAGDVGGVRSDVTTMEWIRDRFALDIKAADLTAIDAHLVSLRETVSNESEDLKAASAEASELRDPLALGPVKAQD